MSLLARLGLVIVRPRAALAVAADREVAGRSGSDLLAVMVILLVATQLRWLVSAAWLGFAVAANLGVRSLVHVLTGTLTFELALLVIAAGVIFVAQGARRELGRAFDLACVAALPPLLVRLVVQTIISIGDLPMPAWLGWAVEVGSLTWMVALVGLAILHERGGPRVDVAPSRAARRAGWSIATIALAGLAVQMLWIAQHPELVRPLETGGAAPDFALAAIGPGGKLGAKVSRAPGKITVVDFWATWCGPCLRSMPHLDQLARKHPEIDVLTINLDDAAAARALFDKQQYRLTLLADDGDASERFGVTTIPHTVVIDGSGALRRVDAGPADLEAQIRALE